jgi:hypothetical protein
MRSAASRLASLPTALAFLVASGCAVALAASKPAGRAGPAPPIPASVADSGRAVGTMTVNGSTVKLHYAWAQTNPDAFDQSKTSWDVILSDVPWNPRDDDQDARVEAGKLHYVELTIGPNDAVEGTMLYHRAFKQGFFGSAGRGHVFEREQTGADVIAGRAYVRDPEDEGGEKFSYAVTFRAPIAAAR